MLSIFAGHKRSACCGCILLRFCEVSAYRSVFGFQVVVEKSQAAVSNKATQVVSTHTEKKEKKKERATCSA
jgi:hypothetical protein